MCVPMDEVCDGVEQCPRGDDETECGIRIFSLINDTYGVTNGASFLYLVYYLEFKLHCLRNLTLFLSKELD